MKDENKIIPIGILLGFVFLAYWPLSMGQNCMKFDILDQYFQYRYFLSDSLSNGIWPQWLPWQYYGFPYFADPQSAAWYAPAWLLASLRPYDLYSLYFEWLAHVFIGGMGLYFLLRKWGVTMVSALTMALLYESNGVFLGNAQHLTFITSTAWLPWVFLSFHQILFKPSLKWTVAGGLILHFFLTGGYPAFFFISIYLIGLLTIVQSIRLYRKRQLMKIKSVWVHLMIASTIFLLLSTGYLYSIFEVLDLMVRDKGLEMEDILFGPFPPKAIISSILPMTVTGNAGFWGADISMIQGFIGLLPFLLLPLAFLHRKYQKAKMAIAAIGLFCLIAAFGEATPIREWLSHLPLLDRFRFPSIFRAFWILSILILGAWGLDALRQLSQKLRWQAIGLSLISLAVVLFLYSQWLPATTSDVGSFPWRGLFFASEDLRPYIENATAYEKFYAGLPLLLSLLVLYLAALFTPTNIRPWTLLGIVALEGFCAVQLTHTMTITHPRPATAYQAALQEMPEDYPIPDLTPLHDNRPADPRFLPSWYNNNVFTKTVSPIGLNPFKLKSVDRMEKRPCYQTALPRPFIFLTQASDFPYRIQQWSPGRLALEVEAFQSDTLVIQQSLYPGWSATINGSEANLIPWCDNLLSLPIEAGRSQITLSFQRPDIKALWIWQGILSLAIALLLLLHYFRKPT